MSKDFDALPNKFHERMSTMKRPYACLAMAIFLAAGTVGCESPTVSIGEDAASNEYVDAWMAKRASQYTSAIKVHASRDASMPVVPGAQATLVTNDAGATFAFMTKELAAGHAYTLWVVVVNAPENCASDPCSPADILFNTTAVKADVTFGAGHVVGQAGNGTFAGHLATGSIPNSWFGNGFTNPRGAEVHLVLNDHGPAIPDMVSNMIRTYRGGCTDASLPPPFPATAKADGIPGPNACQLYQFAVLQQS